MAQRTKVTGSNRALVLAVLACSLTWSAAAAHAEELWMVFQDHKVTITARDTTVPKILERWARVGGTTVVNGDAVQGGPVSLQLTDVPEREALEILLRGADGYIVAEREDAIESASAIGRILILPRSAASARNQPPPTVPAPAPFSQQPEVLSAGASSQPSDPSTFVPAVPSPPAPAAPSGAFTAAIFPVAPPASGTMRPGQGAAPLPTLFVPNSAPTGRPGEAAPPTPTTRLSPGPQPQPPQ